MHISSSSYWNYEKRVSTFQTGLNFLDLDTVTFNYVEYWITKISIHKHL